MHAAGLLMFLAALPLGIVGLCDPDARRGTMALVLAGLSLPAGLVLSAV